MTPEHHQQLTAASEMDLPYPYDFITNAAKARA